MEDEPFQPKWADAAEGEDEVAPVGDERQAEARANLRRRFPKLTDDDLADVHREKKRTSKFELFIDKLIHRYGWSRGVCQQQLGQGLDDIRDC
jgi:hypothetical protein